MRSKFAVIVLAGGLAAPAALGAAPPETPEAAVAGVQVAGPALTVSPRIPFASATLRVAGPGGYEAIGWSDGGPLTLDLLTDGFFPASDGVPGGRAAVLPAGEYGWEVVFWLADGERRVEHGSFVVDAGGAVGERRERVASDGDGGGARQEPRRAVAAHNFVDDSINVLDPGDNGGTNVFLEHGAGTGWEIRNDASGNLGLNSVNGTILQRLLLRSDGRVSVRTNSLGVGTTLPQADLHIFRPGGTIRITDSDACPNPNAAWEIEENFGALMFEVVPNCAGDDTGGKLWIGGTGNVGIGLRSAAARLHVAGGAIVEGDVALGSSRTIKHAIEPLDTEDVLHRVLALPLYRWKYQDDPHQAAHVGPMAEDVHARFRLGRDDRHLSPADSAGLALAAVQGLDARLEREVKELRAANADLTAKNARLRERLAALEARLGDLAERLGAGPAAEPAVTGDGGAGPAAAGH